jgi:hypothetical protein
MPALAAHIRGAILLSVATILPSNGQVPRPCIALCFHGEEERIMRTMVSAALVAVVLAGCAGPAIQRSEAPQPKAGTALAFNVNNDADFKEGQTRATEWCRETYDAPAHYVDRIAGPTGYTVRFACTE